MKLFSHLIHLIFPPYCVACGKKGTTTCASCLSQIPPLPFSLLAQDNFYSLYSYRAPAIQKIITYAKYRGVFSAFYVFAHPLAELIFRIEKERGSFPRPIVLIPIPSTKRSVRKRGFSQTQLLAQHISTLYPNDFVVVSALYRARKNKKQTECADRTERLKNMENVFAITKDAHITPRAVYILIDDVITTGATMRAAQNTLKGVGAHTIYSISISYQEHLHT